MMEDKPRLPITESDLKYPHCQRLGREKNASDDQHFAT